MSNIATSSTTCDSLQSHNKLFPQELYVHPSTLDCTPPPPNKGGEREGGGRKEKKRKEKEI